MLMKISDFVKVYNIDDTYAYYHSLKMKPVYVTSKEHALIQQGHIIGKMDTRTIKSLVDNMILVENDDVGIEIVRKNNPKPYVCLAYFILTEQCNLACRYCFLGNYSNITSETINTSSMDFETADAALKYFSYQTKQDPLQFNDNKEIIFYGGEPLINFKTLKYVVQRSKYYIEKSLLSSQLNFSMVTNGLLLDEEKIEFFKKYDIHASISIDGATRSDNTARIDRSGNEIFERLIKKIDLANKMQWHVGLSITLTPSLLDHLNALIDFLRSSNIYSICFNILHETPSYIVPEEYYQKATDFIIRFYESTKTIPIYEERFARKLNTFINGGIYYSDCAATSGSQIVILPSGAVGICHGCIETHEYFIANIHEFEDLRKNKVFIEWSRLTPLLNDECLSCEALGICGGGCPINAKNRSESKDIHAQDHAFCIHSKTVLNYLIRKLYCVMKENH
jgi:radical SAM domain protein